MPKKERSIVPTPYETAARKVPKRCFWNLLKTKRAPNKPLRNRSRKNAETSLLEPIKKKERPSRFCVQAIAELQPQKSRNVAFGTPKTMESCPSHCETSATRQSETSATRQSLRKLRRERIRKGRAPAGFVPKPLRNRSRKNAETSLLEPTKNKQKTKKKQRNSPLATRTSHCDKQKTKKKQRNSALATRTSHCETAAGKMPKRRFWNPLKRKKECPNHAKPQPENCRNVAFGTY